MAVNYVVRHGSMRFLGEFEPTPEAAYPRGEVVVIRTERGLELGEVLCEASKQAIDYLSEPTKGQIVRAMTEADREQADKLHEREEAEFARCAQFVRERQMPMDLVDVEHLFGGERIIFYFLAEKRVDFRELV